jgi:LacI family transcriptional regulator
VKITIYDVAKKAGVSISTASKALNDRKDVGDSTKERIRQLAIEMNYEPSHFARALAMRKTGNIGVLTVRYYHAPVLTNPFYSRIIEGIEERLINENLNIVTNVLRGEQVSDDEVPKMVREKSVDGIILLGHMPPGFVKMLVEKSPPAVMVDNYVKDAQVTSIMMDNAGGAYAAVSHLIATGHKRIAYVSGPSGRYSFRQRCDGYKKALADNGMAVDDGIIVFHETEETGTAWMEKILSSGKMPDAIFACNDINAIMAINMLKEHSLRVPEDVSVVGFDNIEMSAHFIPSISTVDINKEAMGMKAAEILVDIINSKKNRVENIVFPTTLLVRNSVQNRL